MAPQVSIIIVSHNHPEYITKCLRTLEDHTDHEVTPFEVIVVDNASNHETVATLHNFKQSGFIEKLLLEDRNWMFSEGNNIGVRNADPTSEFFLLLNSDVAIKHDDWLVKMYQWMEGTIKPTPAIWDFHPTTFDGQPRDIISFGWSHDANVEGRVRPEGWCIMYRREWWRDMSPDFPWHYGFEQAFCQAVREGARAGVLFNYAPYVVHREQGSYDGPVEINNVGAPDLTGWFAGLSDRIKSLDFTLGPTEHDSYLDW